MIVANDSLGFNSLPPSRPQRPSINATVHDPEKGQYRIMGHDFIVTMLNPGTIRVVGYLSDTGEIISLTEEQKITASDLGFVLAEVN